jgi:hypothetical protein
MRLFARASLAVAVAVPLVAAACSQPAPSSNFTDIKDGGAVVVDAQILGPITVFDSGSATADAGFIDCGAGKLATRPVPDDPCTRIIEFQPGQGFDPTLMTVVATDTKGTTPIVADATDGWTFDSPQNPQKIVLHGASCAAFKTADVEIITACPPVP